MPPRRAGPLDFARSNHPELRQIVAPVETAPETVVGKSDWKWADKIALAFVTLLWLLWANSLDWWGWLVWLIFALLAVLTAFWFGFPWMVFESEYGW